MKTIRKSFVMGIMAVGFFYSFTAGAQVKQPNFSGRWVINYERSDFGAAPHYTASRAYKIVQKGNDLLIEKTDLTDLETDTLVTEKFTLDGKLIEVTDAKGRIRKISMQWGDDKTSLLETGVSSVPQDRAKEQFHWTEKWSMDDKGTAIVIRKTVTAADGFEYMVKAVYCRFVE